MIIDTYKTAIGSYKYGEGAARAVLICIFLSVFCFVYFRRRSAVIIDGRARQMRSAPSRMIDRYTWYETVGIYAGIAVFLFFVLAPFVEGFLVSLKPLSLLFSSPYSFWPENGSFAAYFTHVGHACRCLAATSSTASSSRCRHHRHRASCLVGAGGLCVRPLRISRARRCCSARFLAVNMFSGAVLLIPLFRLMRSLGVLNTYFAMIVPGVAFLIPSAIWLLRTYMMRIPRELDEAAWVDGASRLYTLRRVILPLAMPGIIVVAITTFIGAYAQQFIFALTFNSKTEYMPLPIGLFAFFGTQEVIWNELMAASFVGIAPALIVIVFLQRYLVAGLTAGAVKQ